MAVPTSADLTDSNVDFAEQGYTGTKLDRLIAVAVRFAYRYTGQQWTGGVFAPADPLEADDEVLVTDVIIRLVEWMAYRNSADVIETLGDFDLISSFSAGSYSETRRSGKDSLEASRAFLRGLFWPVMTPDKQDEWIALDSGVNAPAFGVTEVDWSGGGSGSEYDPYAGEPYPQYENPNTPWSY